MILRRRNRLSRQPTSRLEGSSSPKASGYARHRHPRPDGVGLKLLAVKLSNLMRVDAGRLTLSATDLAHFVGCRHRTALELGTALGKRTKPHWQDPLLEALFARGLAHEKAYVESLRVAEGSVVDLSELVDRHTATEATREAMRGGIDVIVQAALQDEHWYGRPDVLLRVDGNSEFGPWAYEVVDTKLARETRAGTVLQLGVYCDMLGKVQGCHPEWFSVVTRDDMIRYRVDDYAAYFRLMREQLRQTVKQSDETIAAAYYPEPVEHCDICPWFSQCADKRRADDHLSLVAGIGRVHRRELEARDISTLKALGELPLPLPFKPARGAIGTYVRLREQARIQQEAREQGRALHELIEPIESGRGLCRLPEPSPGDLFFDIEGDPMAEDGGHEYLFGIVSLGPNGEPTYQAYWAETRAEERAAFEQVVSLFMDMWETHPDMHVYHYASYEPSALKRLMGRHATCGSAIDRLLHARRFVDLYAVVRQGLRVGVERYSIKKLEPCYDFSRQVPLRDAGRSLRVMEQALELRRMDAVTPEIRQTVEGYNADDCISTLRLRDWLETVREHAEHQGHAVPRPEQEDGTPSEAVTDREQQVAALRERLLVDMPDEPADRSADQHGRWCLAYLLDWHRREDKASWWEYFRLRDLPEEELFDERRAVAGLEFVEEVEKIKKSFVHRYRFPTQEIELRRGDTLKSQNGKEFGKVIAIDRMARTLDIRKGPSRRELHPASLFEHTHVDPKVIEAAIFDVGQRVAAAGHIESASIGSARDLLLRQSPRLVSGAFEQLPDESTVECAVRLGRHLDETVLAIQGPPGTGKTYTAAQMICELVRQGKHVGVTATGHRVIRNLLDAARTAAAVAKMTVDLAHKVGSTDRPQAHDTDVVREVTDNDEALRLLTSGEAHVLGGTPWLWSRPEFAAAVDVLFVDEAGQMSMANAIGISRAARNVVYLGDPQQLEQPQQGTHPPGAGVSALEYILGSKRTMSSDRGLFLPVTWRLAPSICSFTSELFYEGRLEAKPGLEHQRLSGGPIEGNGLWVMPVDHDGNRNASDEEVETVATLLEQLLAPGSRWTNEDGISHPLTAHDIRIVAPYNAHVTRLLDRLAPLGVPIGTVDKFQGQEAPVVIYSMATSRSEDTPRGMAFLFSLNRLNVATSRARCAAVLVASPRLFEPDCSTPRQMKLANALCRYRELAQVLVL